MTFTPVGNGLLLACLMCICAAHTANGYIGYCASFCDYNGHYHQGFYCESSPYVYCCGNEYFRACCSNATHDITNQYPDVYWCDSSAWWIFNWQVILGLLGTIAVLLLCSACCCKLCYRGHYMQRTRNPGDILTVSENVGDSENPPRPDIFNPESAYAFTPPEYNTLPKDPPKYEELLEASGNHNMAYVQEEEVTRAHAQSENTTEQVDERIPDGPPPTYTEADSNNSNATENVSGQRVE